MGLEKNIIILVEGRVQIEILFFIAVILLIIVLYREGQFKIKNVISWSMSICIT